MSFLNEYTKIHSFKGLSNNFNNNLKKTVMDNDLIFMLFYIVIFLLFSYFIRDMRDPLGWDEWQELFNEIKKDLKKSIRGK